ncbi:MAG: hypothetical protein ABL907_18360 [Hyphomicrobium sp.]
MSGPSPFTNRRTMSVSKAEFAASIAKLGPHEVSAAGHPVFALGEGRVEIRYAEAPPKTLGGLLALPQAIVTLDFAGETTAERETFVRQFDIAFQRGGG